jgi:hypothetical protein
MSSQNGRRRSNAITNYEAAARLRAGETLAEVVAGTKIKPPTLEKRLQDAGWGIDGHPLRMTPAVVRSKACGRCGRERKGNGITGVSDICQDCKETVRLMGEAECQKWGITLKDGRRVKSGGRTRSTDPACGTPRGRARHQRHREDVCDPCRLAHNQYKRERRAVKAHA